MNRLKISVVALLSATMLTACSMPEFISDAIPGMGKSNSSSAPTSAESTEPPKPKFDTGKFKTTPSPLKGDTNAETVRTVESFVLAEYMPLPYEVDPILIDTKGGYNVYGPGSLSMHLASNQIKLLEQFPPLYGFLNAASSQTEKVNEPRFAVNHAVLRFEDPETATKVAEAQHEVLTTVGPQLIEGADVTPEEKEFVEGMPNSLISSSHQEYDDTFAVNTFTPHEEYVIYTWASAPAAEGTWSKDYVKKALEHQIPLLEQFPSVKTGAGYGKTDEYPSIDPGGVLIYTIPQPDDAEYKKVPGSYGPRGLSSQFTDPKRMHEILEQNGSKHIGKRESFVFRADTDFGAKAILNAFIDSNLRGGEVEYEEPQNVPDATCTMAEQPSGIQYNCYVLNGRYVGYVTGSSDTKKESAEEAKKTVSQKTAAQYMILEEADQEAGKK